MANGPRSFSQSPSGKLAKRRRGSSSFISFVLVPLSRSRVTSMQSVTIGREESIEGRLSRAVSRQSSEFAADQRRRHSLEFLCNVEDTEKQRSLVRFSSRYSSLHPRPAPVTSMVLPLLPSRSFGIIPVYTFLDIYCVRCARHVLSLQRGGNGFTHTEARGDSRAEGRRAGFSITIALPIIIFFLSATRSASPTISRF